MRSLGFEPNTATRTRFRFSVYPNKYVALDVKKGVELPVFQSRPFELVAFHFSMLFRFRRMDDELLSLVNFLTTNLRNVGLNAQISHEIQTTGVEGAFLRACDELLPEALEGEAEKAWLNKVRIGFLDKLTDLEAIDAEFNQPVVAALTGASLSPSADLPRAFGGLLPRYRQAVTLCFANVTEKDDPREEGEYVLLEPGYVTYFRDKNVNHIHVRVLFESYGLYVLLRAWKDLGVDVESIVSSWIQFSRVTGSALLTLAAHESVDRKAFLDFPLQKYLADASPDGAFPVSSLYLERKVMKSLLQRDTFPLQDPPVSFEELRAVEKLRDAKEHVEKGTLPEAIRLTVDALKSFNRHQQRRATLEALMTLAEVAERMKKYDDARKYLNDALGIARSLPQPNRPHVVGVQAKLGRLYLKLGDVEHALTYFEAMMEYFKALQERSVELTGKRDPAVDRQAAQLMLKLAEAHAERGNLEQATEEIKKALKLAPDDPSVKAGYYHQLSKIHEKKGNEGKAFQTLRKIWAMAPTVEDKRSLVEPLLELSHYLVFLKKNPQAAIKILLEVDGYLSQKKYADFPFLIRTYEILSDAYKGAGDASSASFYANRAREVRRVLTLKGWQP